VVVAVVGAAVEFDNVVGASVEFDNVVGAAVVGAAVVGAVVVGAAVVGPPMLTGQFNCKIAPDRIASFASCFSASWLPNKAAVVVMVVAA
jgi:hypothetical protein